MRYRSLDRQERFATSEPKSQKVSCQQVKAERECADRERILKLINSLKHGQYLRIRRLTPEECFRFMGVEQFYINRILNPYETLKKECYTEEQITRLMTIDGHKCKTSDYSLYGRVGNSIVVNVLTAIFTAMIAQYPDYFQDVKELSPEELRAARKRESQRKYYENIKKKYVVKAVNIINNSELTKESINKMCNFVETTQMVSTLK